MLNTKKVMIKFLQGNAVTSRVRWANYKSDFLTSFLMFCISCRLAPLHLPLTKWTVWLYGIRLYNYDHQQYDHNILPPLTQH